MGAILTLFTVLFHHHVEFALEAVIVLGVEECVLPFLVVVMDTLCEFSVDPVEFCQLVVLVFSPLGETLPLRLVLTLRRSVAIHRCLWSFCRDIHQFG